MMQTASERSEIRQTTNKGTPMQTTCKVQIQKNQNFLKRKCYGVKKFTNISIVCITLTSECICTRIQNRFVIALKFFIFIFNGNRCKIYKQSFESYDVYCAKGVKSIALL